ncbi:MAG: ATP-binding protein [Candidatus Kapaibacteriota bacterium]
MKTFSQIAIPNEDIVQGKFTMDVYAADLWKVVDGNAPSEYQDSDLFFRKTYVTKGLKNILDIAKARLEGRSGDFVIQLHTPFGGGKTHTLIALYHKAKEWNCNVAVIDGTALNPKVQKLWEEIERQLTGSVRITNGDTAPGKEALFKLLSDLPKKTPEGHSPTLILMDEVLQYTTKAAGIKVGDSNLKAQTLAFLQELTGAVSSVGNSLVVASLPSSTLEHWSEDDEKTYQQLKKIFGRVEKSYVPVEDDEIELVIKQRLFNSINEKEAKEVVNEFVGYAKQEGLLTGDEETEYRNKFIKSYPFKPEVIDILYKRWGSFPSFQRTRGVLRILSIVVYELLNQKIPFIRLGDFNLENVELRRELINHIGQEWDSIIAQDITSANSGSKKVDKAIGSSYRSYELGTLVSTTIFMMSFSGRGKKDNTLTEIKLSCVEPTFNHTVIDTVLTHLKEKLFYLSDEGLFFTNQPNLNRIITSREENITEDEILEEWENIIKRHISKETKFRIYLHPKSPKDIPDNVELKLVILNKKQPEQDFLEKNGEIPRIYRNTLIFLCVDDKQEDKFYNYIRKLLALASIERDKELKLTEGQKAEVANKLKNHKQKEYDELRNFYRKLFLPNKDGFKEIDVGLPTVKESYLDAMIYSYLRNESEILEKIAPKVIKDKYLKERNFIEIKMLYESLLKTPGELRIVSREGFIEGIREGVKNGLFGFGYLEDEKPVCKWINTTPEIYFASEEVILRSELCREKDEASEEEKEISGKVAEATTTGDIFTTKENSTAGKMVKFSKIKFNLKVPVGQMSTITKIVNYLKDRSDNCNVIINLELTNLSISKSDYEDKILDAIKQAGIEAQIDGL